MRNYPFMLMLLAVLFPAGLIRADEPATQPAREIHIRTASELAGALAAIEPGQTLLLHAGNYEGRFSITRGGTPDQPVTIRPAGDGTVQITCPPNSLRPALEDQGGGANLSRTLSISRASDLVIDGLSIHGGILLGEEESMGKNPAWQRAAADVEQYVREHPDALFKTGGWIATIGYVRGRFGPGPAGIRDGEFPPLVSRVTIQNCDLTGRGIGLWRAHACKLLNNKVHDVDPFIPGIVLQFMCMQNDVIGNDVSGMYTTKHHHQGEGIRMVNGSCYNLIMNNFVHDIRGIGFGITTDLFCDYNTIAYNRVARVRNVAYTGQAWDSYNKWIHNVAEDANIGFEFSSWWWSNDPTNQPTSGCEVRGNRAVRCTNADLAAGRINGFRFSDNNFRRVHFSPRLAETFGAHGGLWDGSPTLPQWISTEEPKRDLRFEF